MNIILCGVYWRAVFVNIEYDSGRGVDRKAVAIGERRFLE